MSRPAAVLILSLLAAGMYALSASPTEVPGAKYSVTIDDVIDGTGVQHYTFAHTKQCITPESSVCWEPEPEVEIQ